MRKLLLVVVAGCHGHSAASPSPDATVGCLPGKAGAACVLALYDQAAASCDLTQLRAELDARAGLGPLWADGRALFRTTAPTNIAGDWNAWSPTALATAPLCGSDLVLAVTPVPSGYHPYKLVAADQWSLDPGNPAFAFDGFSGNPDHRNSLLDTPDSGRGQLVNLERACSTALGNCRDVTAYLPAGYDAPENAMRGYPVLFMHDGQNVWDDATCCESGWQINVELDSDPMVAPIIVIAAGNTAARNNEYGLDPATTDAFIAFQVGELQPHALAQVRGDGQRVYVAGSSLGGLISMKLALAHPETYAGIASLSGSFWAGIDIPGKLPLAVYLDSGGDPADNSDSAADTISVRDRLLALGYAPVEYYLEPGAQHNEAAWRGRTWRFLRFLFPGSRCRGGGRLAPDAELKRGISGVTSPRIGEGSPCTAGAQVV